MKIDYIALSIPVFFILIGVELIYNFYKKLNYYRLNDSLSNLSQGVGQKIIEIFMKTALFFGYSYIFTHWRFFTLSDSIWIWVILFIGVDFFYYWFHRMSHEVNALWAAHIVHHQSEEYNLTVALRQSWFQSWFSWIFYLPLAFLGFNPIMFITLSAMNTLYQFWIHTRAIRTMGILEYILNTPSHHRVHHGSNPKYIDKNHAGTLIIWDRMFGTFQKEEEDVYFGITKPLNSWNPVWANLHYWHDLIHQAGASKTLSDKIQVFLRPPGWFPEYLGGVQKPMEIDALTYQKYNPTYPKALVSYLLLQFVVALGGGTALIFLGSGLSVWMLIIAAVFIVFTLTTCSALLDQHGWHVKGEYLRLIIGVLLTILFNFPIGFTVLLILTQLLSLVWFYSIQLKLKNEITQTV